MAPFAAGDVVTVPFPASVDRVFKVRPWLVLAAIARGKPTDYVLCAITSQITPDPAIIILRAENVLEGRLDRVSYIRPTYLFTVHGSLIMDCIARVDGNLLTRAQQAVWQAMRPNG